MRRMETRAEGKSRRAKASTAASRRVDSSDASGEGKGSAVAGRGGRTSAREIDPERSRLRRSVVGGDRSRRGGCPPPAARGMNAAREDANARDMFRARRRKSRVERGSGSDGLRDGGWTGRMGAGAPLLCEVDMSADRVRDLGRKCSLRDTGQTRQT